MSSVLKQRFSLLITKLQSGLLYTIVVLGLALFSFATLFYEFWEGARVEYILVFDTFDLCVAYIFLIDFWLGYFFNLEYKTRSAYWRDNWLNLVSSIPVTSELTQALRVLRVLRATRVIRVILNAWMIKKQWASRKQTKHE